MTCVVQEAFVCIPRLRTLYRVRREEKKIIRECLELRTTLRPGVSDPELREFSEQCVGWHADAGQGEGAKDP